MSYEGFCKNNKEIKIMLITDSKFLEYGSIIEDIDFSAVEKFMANSTIIPTNGNVYVADIVLLHSMEIHNILSSKYFNNNDIQIGYCNGRNTRLNALEYHGCKEVIYSLEDIALILGKQNIIKEDGINTSDLDIFYLPKKTPIALNEKVLHFSPIKTCAEGFKTVIVLSKNTNVKLENKLYDDYYFAENKWLYVHEDAEALLQKGAKHGLVGENIELKY